MGYLSSHVFLQSNDSLNSPYCRSLKWRSKEFLSMYINYIAISQRNGTFPGCYKDWNSVDCGFNIVLCPFAIIMDAFPSAAFMHQSNYTGLMHS